MTIDKIRNKKILYITTKNIDYIRINQEIRLLCNSNNYVNCIYSDYNCYIIKIIQIYFKLLITKMKKYDIVFVGFAPQLILPFWKWKFKSQHIIVDFFISLQDTLVYDRKIIRNKSIIAKVLLYLDKMTLQTANHILADTQAHGSYFVMKLGALQNKIEVLYLEANTSIYYPRAQEKKENLKNKFVVLYFGSMLPLQGVEIILDAVARFKNDNRFHFQIIGPICNKHERPIADNIEYIDWLSQEKLAIYITNADLCLAGHFSGDIEKAKRTIPGKAYIYEAMGKTMVLGENIANHELFEEDAKHYFVKMGDSEAVSNIILKLQTK